MANNGTPVNFSFQSAAGISIASGAALSGILLQTAEHSRQADKETTLDGQGARAARGWHHFRSAATLEWVVAGTSLATALSNSSLASITPGAFFVITCTTLPDLTGSWEVQEGPKISGSNTTSKRISVPLEYAAGVTQAAS